jgi:hypothetical protein
MSAMELESRLQDLPVKIGLWEGRPCRRLFSFAAELELF